MLLLYVIKSSRDEIYKILSDRSIIKNQAKMGGIVLQTEFTSGLAKVFFKK